MGINLFINLLVLASAIILAVVYTKAYLNTTGSWYSRLWQALKISATLVWQMVVILVAKTLDIVDVVANYASAGAGDQLRAAVDPRYVAAVVIGIALVTILARLRSIWRGNTA